MIQTWKMSALTRALRSAAIGFAAACAIALPAQAQNDQMTPMATPAQKDAIVLGTGPLPGATAHESWHQQYGSAFARNVTIATLTPFLPDPAKANGTAVIVAPGGGFMTLSMENEGSQVAQALAAHGVAAFLLKYRLNQTPADLGAFQSQMAAMFAGAGRRPPTVGAPQMPSIAPMLADSHAAFALIRQNAAQWPVEPARSGRSDPRRQGHPGRLFPFPAHLPQAVSARLRPPTLCHRLHTALANASAPDRATVGRTGGPVLAKLSYLSRSRHGGFDAARLPALV